MQIHFLFFFLPPADGCGGEIPLKAISSFFNAISLATSGCQTVLSPAVFNLRTFSPCSVIFCSSSLTAMALSAGLTFGAASEGFDTFGFSVSAES